MSFNNGIFYPSLDEDSSHLDGLFSFDHEQEDMKVATPIAQVNSDLEYMHLLEQLSLEETNKLKPTAVKPDTLPAPSQPIPICSPVQEVYSSTYPPFKSRLDSFSQESDFGSLSSIVFGTSPQMASYESQFGTSPVSTCSPWSMTQPMIVVGNMGMDPFANSTDMKDRYCEFCFNNERVQMERIGLSIKPSEPGKWHTHICKDAKGNVVCPVLYKFNCKYCGATGSKAHTRRYCPIYQQKMAADTDKPTLIRTDDLIKRASQIPEEVILELENLAKTIRNLKHMVGENPAVNN